MKNRMFIAAIFMTLGLIAVPGAQNLEAAEQVASVDVAKLFDDYQKTQDNDQTTIADLERSDGIERRHLAEALAYRAMPLLA